MSQGTEILIESNFWLGMYVPYILKAHFESIDQLMLHSGSRVYHFKIILSDLYMHLICDAFILIAQGGKFQKFQFGKILKFNDFGNSGNLLIFQFGNFQKFIIGKTTQFPESL